MSTVDFKKIKDELLEIQNKYVPVSQISKDGITNAGEPIPSGEVRAQQNTYEVVKECEALIKKAIKSLTEKGVSVDQLVISSNMGVFCRLDYFNELKEYYKTNDKMDEKTNALMQTLHIKIFPEIVPVSFIVNTAFTGTEDCTMDNFVDKNELNNNNSSLETVSGIVNWEKFVIEMNSLGYNIDFFNHRKGLSFFDYAMEVKQNGSHTQINITADLGKAKKYTLSKM